MVFEDEEVITEEEEEAVVITDGALRSSFVGLKEIAGGVVKGNGEGGVVLTGDVVSVVANLDAMGSGTGGSLSAAANVGMAGTPSSWRSSDFDCFDPILKNRDLDLDLVGVVVEDI